MRATLIIHALTSGGAERVLSIMANQWAAKGWSLTFLTFDDGTVPPFYELDQRVRHIPLDMERDSPNLFAAISNNFKRVQTLRSAIIDSRPDVVISFLDTTNVTTLLATRNLPFPIIVDEQNHPAMCRANRSWELLRQWMYPKADRVVAITERALNYFSPAVQARGCVIPNPAMAVNLAEKPAEKLLTGPSLIAVGRLNPQKGFDLLLDAFAPLRDRHPDWNLTVLGEGELRAELEAQRDQLGLNDRVHFIGAVKNPNDFLQQADIFVMSSRFEGFPNALCEAMASGLPVISADCLSGPREIIRDRVDGLLVPPENVTALTAAMEQLMTDETARQKLAARAPEVTERFGIETVMQMWESLITTVLDERQQTIALSHSG
ncbi:glycosyltransferase family 4 protein [filamentous cyanobacterium LEGE 11480]|uniref:Glycosyltransferase family 4 protein n=1 Tax=Romeriopsis navalis LEGE 11480 TaxID=2777977 RepID=A0A928VJ48_9CYAN|nr:glycosyltransferase family 4 protein [Romeriopsis navalis]MBE9028703.1 glycosyltransferase family 4 protein [Romeriopsis navalis LEGE 11480]